MRETHKIKRKLNGKAGLLRSPSIEKGSMGTNFQYGEVMWDVRWNAESLVLCGIWRVDVVLWDNSDGTS